VVHPGVRILPDPTSEHAGSWWNSTKKNIRQTKSSPLQFLHPPKADLLFTALVTEVSNVSAHSDMTAMRSSTRRSKAVKFVDLEPNDREAEVDQTDQPSRDGTPPLITTERYANGNPNDTKLSLPTTTIISNERKNKRKGDIDEEWEPPTKTITGKQGTIEAVMDEEQDEMEELEDEAVASTSTSTPSKPKKSRAFKRQSKFSIYDFSVYFSIIFFYSSDLTPDGTKHAVKSHLAKAKNVGSSTKQETKHMCSYCNYCTTKKYLLQRHLKSHSTERPHKCTYCERSFKTTLQLQNHVNTHLGVKPFKCKFCPYAFTTSGELIRHVRYKHTLEKPHKCDTCEYATVELSKLRRHIRTHTGEKPYCCEHCDYRSPDTFKLKRERPYQCTICNFRFTQSNSLKAHMLTHEENKQTFSCTHCPSVMARKSDLRYHIEKQHTLSTEPLACDKCEQDFPDKYSLRMHGKTHYKAGGNNSSLLSCTMCDYTTQTLSQLKEHRNKHKDSCPFQCSECGLTYPTRGDLRQHTTKFHRFLASSDVTGGSLLTRQSYRCMICSRTFANLHALEQHTVNIHRIQDGDNETVEMMEMRHNIHDIKEPLVVKIEHDDKSFYNRSILYDHYDNDLVDDEDNDIATEVQVYQIDDDENKNTKQCGFRQEMFETDQSIEEDGPVIEYRSSQISSGIKKVPTTTTTIKKFEDFNTMNDFSIATEQFSTSRETLTDTSTTIQIPLTKKRKLIINRKSSKTVDDDLKETDVFGFNE
ncbi:unnamed protein product, partial [Didymodactylos carnosus]